MHGFTDISLTFTMAGQNNLSAVLYKKGDLRLVSKQRLHFLSNRQRVYSQQSLSYRYKARQCYLIQSLIWPYQYVYITNMS